MASVASAVATTESADLGWDERLVAIADEDLAIFWHAAPPLWGGSGLQGWVEFTGMSLEQLSGEGWMDAVHPEDRRRVKESWDLVLAKGKRFSSIHRLRRRDGAYRWMAMTILPTLDAKGAVSKVVGVAVDQTDLADSQHAWRDALRMLQLAVESASMALFFIRADGHIALAAGQALLYTEGHPAPLEGSHISYLVPNDPAAEDAVRKAFAGEGAEWEGVIWGRWCAVRLSPVLNEDRELTGVTCVAIDRTELHAAEECIRAEKERAVHTLEGTVTALSSVVELRDPYTAGHQRKVAALALAIARDLDWEQQRLEPLRMASLLHDVGKMMCPAELLSKPSRLTDAEMSLVRAHCAAGGTILSDIQFEGPIVPAVLQHHERLDGSGYPAGLAGEQILPEARIIAVADVVEAMASHRPYRPALGIEAALAEIRSGSGRLYDPDVVEACLRVFSGGFDFEG